MFKVAVLVQDSTSVFCGVHLFSTSAHEKTEKELDPSRSNHR